MRQSLIFFILVVFASPCLAHVTIATKNLPNGTVDEKYSATIKAIDGCTPYTWKVVSGKLPAGVKDEPSSSTQSLDLTGTPTKAKTYSFTVEVTGCRGKVAEQAYTVTIQSAENHVVDLSWQASTSNDIAGYNVYRSTNDSSWTKINASLTASTSYTDSTVADDRTYYYAVTAVNTNGEESVMSEVAKAVIP